MITIDQLLESVDLDFEPRFVTKDENGVIKIWEEKPEKNQPMGWWFNCLDCSHIKLLVLKLAEFDGKDWTKCIYEVPRKTTGKIEKLPEFDRTEASIFHAERLYSIVNKLVDAVNELKGVNNG